MSEFLTSRQFDRFEAQLWERLDRIDDFSRKQGEDIAVHESRLNQMEEKQDNHKSDTRETASVWGAALGAMLAAFVAGLAAMFKGGQ